jgi:predicted DNA-binding helix-hairpin-helix protein
MDLEAKLAVLADAAKYDASRASSGVPKRTSAPGRRNYIEGLFLSAGIIRSAATPAPSPQQSLF